MLIISSTEELYAFPSPCYIPLKNILFLFSLRYSRQQLYRYGCHSQRTDALSKAGDLVNRIHWKISARTGKLSTRLFDTPHVRSGRTIDLDALVRNGVERGLSIAAGRVLEAGREGVPIGLKDRGVLTPPAPGRAARLELLGRLAIYAPDRGGEDRL